MKSFVLYRQMVRDIEKYNLTESEALYAWQVGMTATLECRQINQKNQRRKSVKKRRFKFIGWMFVLGILYGHLFCSDAHAQKQPRRTKPPISASEDPVKMAKIIVNLVDENQQLRYNAGNLDYNTGVYTSDLEKIMTVAELDSFRAAWGLKNPPRPEPAKPDSAKTGEKKP